MIGQLLRLAMLVWFVGVAVAVTRDGYPFVEAAGNFSVVWEAVRSLGR